MSLIILINTAAAPNQVRLPAFDICNPHGKRTAEPTPDMQSRGERFVERVKKTESCRQWAGFTWLRGLLLVCEFSFLFGLVSEMQIPGQHKAWVLC